MAQASQRQPYRRLAIQADIAGTWSMWGHHTICTKSYALMSVFKASGRDNALTGFADVGNFVTAAHGRRRGCVTTVEN
jgi:hypothetical protein